jgi:hypothetical protein
MTRSRSTRWTKPGSRRKKIAAPRRFFQSRMPPDPRSRLSLPIYDGSSGTFKVCPNCRRSLAVEEFAVDRSKASGRKSHCKECDNARAKAYYAAVSSPARRYLTALDAERRRDAVALLRGRGCSTAEVARVLRVDVSTVRRDVRALAKRGGA